MLLLLPLLIILSFLVLFSYRLYRNNQQLKQRQNKLASALEQEKQKNKDMLELFSAISHDLRTPFASLQHLLLASQTSSFQQYEQQQFLQRLSSEFKRSLSLLNELLNWSSSQLELASLKLETINPHECLDLQAEYLRDKLEQKRLHFINQIPSDLRIVTDKVRFNYILRNLLSNAIKYSYPQQQILCFTKQNKLGELLLCIQDYGIGLDQAQLVKINKGQYLTDREAGTLNEKGAGIGLLVSREFARSLGIPLSLSAQRHAGCRAELVLQEQLIKNKQHSQKPSYERVED